MARTDVLSRIKCVRYCANHNLKNSCIMNMMETIRIFVERIIELCGIHGQMVPVSRHILLVIVAIILAWLSDLICRKIFVPIIVKFTAKTDIKWDDVLLNRKVLVAACQMKYQYQNAYEQALRMIGLNPLNETMAGDIASNDYANKQAEKRAKDDAIDDFLDEPTAENAAKLNELGVTPKSIKNEM